MSAPAAVSDLPFSAVFTSSVVMSAFMECSSRLGYFEKNYSFCDNSKLTKEFIIHYTGQAVKQMYVLVLGLDVLGNPFGLLRGLTEGIEDLFYEPYQGAIQGPDEFLQGLTLGIRSLFGHTVGGTASAVSRITGSLGKGLAALAFDQKYEQRRREQSRKIPSNSREAFALGGKELVMGVYGGFTGIITMPMAGARENGFPGFLKGMGMGLVGVIVKPASGVMCFASRSLEGIQRFTDISEEIQHLRPPHTFSRDGVMNAYNYEEAEGCSLLMEINKGEYVDTDNYVAHAKLKEDNKNIKVVFMVTDKRIMLARRSNIFGVWSTEWMFTYDELEGAPEATNRGIEFVLRDKEKRTMFMSDTSKKELAIPDPEVVQVIVFKIAEAMKTGVIKSVPIEQE